MLVIKISLYLFTFVLSNFIVLWFGATGLIFTALFLIPFDFVMRCMFHEQWKGIDLVIRLGCLISVASLLTLLINKDSINIATASMLGFVSAQTFAGIFYQSVIKKSVFIKVNGSDFIGIIVDSIIFQLVAFCYIDWKISASQIFLKVCGGLFWYWIIFKKYKFHEQWK